MIAPRQGFRLIKKLEGDEVVVAMIEFQGKVLIATDRRVFRTDVSTGKLIEIPFEVEDG